MREILAIELQNLIDLDLDFDISVTGFEMPEIDVLIGDLEATPQKPDPADAVPEIDGPGRHAARRHLADRPASPDLRRRHEPETYARLLDGEKAQMVFTDPPYNVPIEGHVSGLGKVRHREFAMATGEMTEAEFTGFLTVGLRQSRRCVGRRRDPLHRHGLAPHRRGA